ncbi:hypothetical protein IQ273_10680 [Nodosilinea sp. LEGE 07298]|uniref:hypothetical protein n=1 Tax=Nodosilinea sp. LEGE 07298 TaxID=2777970 RepID=UPI00187F5315|nr:hypothetical protein [Nodosilinea sp. LEGE 07298]MBE9109873.1 hypothetical protein [Nodosilinea sp. LEGE 07298]
MASLSQTFDTTRDEIVAVMEQRIDKGDRTKLTKKEFRYPRGQAGGDEYPGHGHEGGD